MKFFGVLMMVVMAASCAKTDDIGGGNSRSGEEGSITFTFEGLKHSVQTYVSVTPGKDEDKADFTKSNIYMFDNATGLLEEVFAMNATNVSVTAAGTGYTVKISGISAYNPTDKVFYFVVNNETVSGISATKGVTTETLFLDNLTDKLSVTAGVMDNIETPLLFTGKSAAISPADPTSATVTLKRRVARFDIVNPHPTFTIKKVYISDANQQALVFSNSTATPAIDAFSAETLDFTGTPLTYETIGADRISRSVFYLNPTKIGSTNITIEASFGAGMDKLYYVDGDMDILANHRYKLIVNENMTFSLVLAEWDEGDEAEFVPGDARAFSLISLESDGSGTLSNTSYELKGSETATVSVLLKVLSSQGADLTVDGPAGIVGTHTATTPVLTYGGAYYTQEFTIPTDYTTVVAGSEVFLTFRDKSNPTAYQQILLYDETPTRTVQPAANSYIVAPGEDYIKIPISRAYEHWGAALAADAVFEPVFVWTDHAGGMSIDKVSCTDWAYTKFKGQDAVLYVKPGTVEGNTVVGVKVKGTNDIVWSWHIWVTNYDPNTATVSAVDGKYAATSGDVFRYTSTMVDNGTTHAGGSNIIMDRNLGAMNATPGDVNSQGLYYQWGRKDPFISKKTWVYEDEEIPMYDKDGKAVYITSTSISNETITPTGNNLQLSINNPDVFIYAPNYGDWYSSDSDPAARNNSLWGYNGTTTYGKGLYDPCPTGWKVSKNGTWNGLVIANSTYSFPWSSQYFGRFGTGANISPTDFTSPVIAEPGSAATVGYFPAAGSRGASLANIGKVTPFLGIYSMIWSSTPRTDEALAVRAYYFFGDKTSVSVNGDSTRATALSVRCVKE